MYKDIAQFLSTDLEWVESWLNVSVKKKPNIDIPEFVISLFDILHIEHFNKSLKLNRNWYKECRRELEERRNLCIKKYWNTVEDFKEVRKDLHKFWKDNIYSGPSYAQCSNKFDELVNKKTEDFGAWVNVDQAILRCGFPDLIDHKEPRYYIQMHEWMLDPYEIPTQETIQKVYFSLITGVMKTLMHLMKTLMHKIITYSACVF